MDFGMSNYVSADDKSSQKKVDKLGRVRPSSYRFTHQHTRNKQIRLSRLLNEAREQPPFNQPMNRLVRHGTTSDNAASDETSETVDLTENRSEDLPSSTSDNTVSNETSETVDLTENRSEELPASTSDNAASNEISETVDQIENRSEEFPASMSDFTASNIADDDSNDASSKSMIQDILSQMLQDRNNHSLLVDDNSDGLISDDKWHELMSNNLQDCEDEELTVNQEPRADTTDYMNTHIYPGHGLTIHISMVLILLYTICHSTSGAQLDDLLTLISIHCLHPHPGLKSIHVFKRYFANLQTPIKKHFYCVNCMSSISESDVICSNKSCGMNLNQAKSKGYFIETPLETQLKNLLMKEDIQTQLKHRFSRLKKKNNGIEDIYDGQIYKKLSQPGGPLSEQFPYNVSFTWNTDGIPVFKSSKFSIWPFYLVVNELPYKQRMQKENMLLYGLWFGESKPVMHLFSRPLMESLKNMETNGVEFQDNNVPQVCKGFLISGTADLPAKSLVQNCNQFNGAYSCLKCMHPGETYKTDKGGCVHVFPFDASQPAFNERTTETCLTDAIAATAARKHVNGIKGPSFLMTLSHYDFCMSTSIDYMHGVLLGITKLLLNLWIGSKGAKQIFSISQYVDIIDSRLLHIKPPAFITRTPRTLSNHFKYWKASELRSWLLFYSLPVLNDILPSNYLVHYACLVEAVYMLCTDCVTQSDIRKSQLLLNYFVHMFPSFYGERYITLNMHSLLHLPQCVEQLGPLWVYSCFPFEDANGVLLDLFHGTQHVELQILSSISIIQNIPNMLSDVRDKKLITFINKMKHKSIHHKPSVGTSAGSFPLGSVINIHVTNITYTKLIAEIGYVPITLHCFNRISLRGATLHSSEYSRVRVRNTYTIKYHDSDSNNTCFGSICYYILVKKCDCHKVLCQCESALVAVLTKYDEVKDSVIDANFLSVRAPHIRVTKKTNTICVVDVTKILSIMVNVSLRSMSDDQHGHLNFLCDVPNLKECD